MQNLKKNIAHKIYHVDKTKHLSRIKALLPSGFLQTVKNIQAYIVNDFQEKMASFLLSIGPV